MSFILKVSVPARIAISLYDMNGNLGRIDGGMGFSLDWPRLVFSAKKIEGKDISIEGRELELELRNALCDSLKKLQQLYGLNGVAIRFQETIQSHLGFGSKTATLLSTSCAYGKLYGFDLDFRELGVLLKRGGTSGVGINLIDKGGFILEGGHSTTDKNEFVPSSATTNIIPAPILVRYVMPDWDVLICVPNLQKTHGQKEVDFFKKVCPIPEDEVAKLARITLSQTLPSIAEGNLKVFCNSLNGIQTIGWKKHEVNLYGGKLLKLMQHIKYLGAWGIGMSSIGPGLYAVGGDLQFVRNHLLRTEPDSFHIVKITKPNNHGLTVVEEKK